jgi:predicted dehydrogenase
MADDVRFGIIGTGGIAAAFARDMQWVDGGRVVAVGSRSANGAERFGEVHQVPHRHSSYEDLVEDDDVDVVYVATPHPWHAENALAAIANGKHVLVEKPFAMNGDEARRMASAARDARVFCMEAMWTRFLPHTIKIRELITDGALGNIRTVTADHGQYFAPDPKHRLFAPELGGGALLDLGVYVVSWAQMVLGTPTSVTSASDPAFTGVDGQTSAILRYADGVHAVITCTLWAQTTRRAAISGTEASIDVDPVFYAPTTFTLRRRGGDPERFNLEAGVGGQGKGLRFQALEVVRCVTTGLTESPGMTLDESVAIMETMDRIREQATAQAPADAPAR